MAKKNKPTFTIDKGVSLKKVLSHNVSLINFVYAAIVLNILNLVLVLILQKNLPPQVPLFYGFTEGEQQLASPYALLIPGAFSLVLVLLNTSLSFVVKNEFLKKTLTTTSFTISLLSSITVAKIILLVGHL